MPLLAAIEPKDFLHPLALFGFAAQFMFMLRFVIQWYVSERRGRSYVPVAFWYLSLAGGIMLFAYATMREDVVFMCGQALGVLIYVRNLVLIHRRRIRLRHLKAPAANATSRERDLKQTATVPPTDA
ncbi:MAG TPA: lipid-A-disaccharide synthase N-terminal domain-containing protein [Phycisphaerae bacterium]|nr:lipid-A-disaccharide synthase N-terminal domain-containing protein [Phycisphaerae bacterium]